jgi:NAD(P)H-hydrate epimerase
MATDMARLSPNLIVKELNDQEIIVPRDFDIIKELFPKIDSIIIGPGLGTNKITQTTIKKIIILANKQKIPMIVDADAIEIIGRNPEIIDRSSVVITPHAAEFKKLTNEKLSNDIKDRKEKVKLWASKLNSTILLKGPTDVISNGINIKLNEIHNEAMTVGGTGDVLAGIIGGLLSKGVEPFHAARMAAFINGAAGNAVFKKYSYGLVATDIIEKIPNVLKTYLS